MALNHTSNTSKSEPPWTEVDQDRLPRNSHSDMGVASDSSTWKNAHHWVQDAVVGTSGRYTKGQMFLHSEGLKIALSETRKLDKNHPVRAHLLAHSKAIGLDEKETASLEQTQASIKQTESIKTSALADFNLKAICEEITKCESIEVLKAIEDSCLLHFSQAEKSGKSWIEKNKAKLMSGQVQQLVSYRRRAILSLPDIAKAQAEYELGRRLGLTK